MSSLRCAGARTPWRRVSSYCHGRYALDRSALSTLAITLSFLPSSSSLLASTKLRNAQDKKSLPDRQQLRGFRCTTAAAGVNTNNSRPRRSPSIISPNQNSRALSSTFARFDWESSRTHFIYVRRFSSPPPSKKEEQQVKNQHDSHQSQSITTTSASKESGNPNFWANWRRAMKSPPNIITMTRLLCSPLLSYWIITGEHQLAVVGCMVAGASDWVDGYLAKHHNMATILGGYLDPMADKIIINMLACSLWYTAVLPTPLVALWLGRDVLLIIGTATYVRSQSTNNATAFDPTVTPLQVQPTMVGKVNTVLQFVTLGVGIIYPTSYATSIPLEAFTGLCYLTGATTIASGFSYINLSAFTNSGNENNTK